MRLEKASTMMKPHTRRSARHRVEPAAEQPIVNLGLFAGGGVSRSTRTAARATSSSKLAQMKRRSDDSEAVSPWSSRRRWWMVAMVTSPSQSLMRSGGAARSRATSSGAGTGPPVRGTSPRRGPPIARR
jgi:hypothetical protein